jgi:DHA2 family multidrug resistance protein
MASSTTKPTAIVSPKAGDLLAQIDPRPFQATLDQAIAKEAQDQAQLGNARLNLQRDENLVTDQFATQQTVDNEKASVAQLEATIKGDEAAIENARVQLGYTTIPAPISGHTGILWQFIAAAPLVKFRLLGRRNFGLGTLGNFLLGFALYGAAYLLPQYLAVAQGFDAEQIGEVVAWTGLPQLLVIPLVPLLMKRIDSRLLVAVGLVIFAASCFMNLWLDQDYAAPQLFWPNVIRALGQAIVMTPISAIALAGIAQSEAGAASGLFNMMRNLGGAIGTAAIETFFTHREQFHSAMITPQVSLVDPATRDRLADLQRYFMAHGYPDPAGAMHRAIIAVGQTIRAQATIMGYADSFALIGVVLLIAVLAVAMLRKGAATGGAAH